jgi:hypothetical protein
MGDRAAGDEVEYPNDDIKIIQSSSGEWTLMHKDGRPY